jgi:hypothetical protein
MENVDIFYANLEYITAMVLFMVIWYFCGNNPSFLYIYCVKKHLAILVEVSISFGAHFSFSRKYYTWLHH